MLKYGNTQPSVLVSNNPTQPVYTIAYRPNNGGNVLTSNILSGPAATTYVTATRNQIAEINSLNSDSETEDRGYQIGSKRQNLKKVLIKKNEFYYFIFKDYFILTSNNHGHGVKCNRNFSKNLIFIPINYTFMTIFFLLLFGFFLFFPFL